MIIKKFWKKIFKRPTKRVSRAIKVRVAALVTVGIAAAIAGASLAIHHSISADLPRIYALKDYRPPAGTRVYSEDDHLIGRITTEKGIFVPLAQIPDNMKQAVLAVEDAKFYRHEGLDYQGIVRAIFRDLMSASFREGGSTITQQLAKLMFLTPEKSLVRKIKEAVLARRMEKELTKDEIFELYLNKAYFGRGAYGVELAARAYFGKRVGDLSLAEAAMIAGMLKSPRAYSPYRDMERARQRNSVVLARMADEGFVSRGAAETAAKEELRLRDIREDEDVAPHLVELLRVYLVDKYGEGLVYGDGLKVRTTVNYRLQKAARDALEEGVDALEKRQGIVDDSGVQGALVALDPYSGRVRAMVGGVDFVRNEFNHAVNARRQPGSAFKPFVFAAAMEYGFSPASVIVDEPRSYDDGKWSPSNFDREFHGPTTLRDALAHSRNVVTVELLSRVGVKRVAELSRSLGMGGPFPDDLTLALGSGSATPMEITGAYCAFANGGVSVRPYYIHSVTGPDGKLLEGGRSSTERVLSTAAAYQVTSMLEDVIRCGTASSASWLSFPVAGKTGTTDDNVDAWFVGYSPELVAGVWVGYDENKSLGQGETAARAALPIWARFMSRAVSVTGAGSFDVPEDIVFADVDADTGLAPDGDTSHIMTEVFRKGEEPGWEDSWFDDVLSPAGIKGILTGEPSR